MSHLRRGLVLIMLALLGWLVAFGAVGTVSATAAVASPAAQGGTRIGCC